MKGKKDESQKINNLIFGERIENNTKMVYNMVGQKSIK